MWCFILGCVTLLHFQNVKAQGIYQYPERFDTNRRSYAAYPNNGGAYSNYGNRRIWYPTDSLTYLSSVSSNAATGTIPTNVSTGTAYPLIGTISTPYQSNIGTGVVNPSVINGAAYPNTGVGIMYPSNIGTGVVNPNVASGAAIPNVGVGTPYQSNIGTGVVNTNIVPGAFFPNIGVAGTPYQSNSGTGVMNPNVATGVVNPNVATGAVYPNIGMAGTPYQSNSRTGVMNPNVATGFVNPNVATGAVYPNIGGVGTPYQSNPGTNVVNTNAASGAVYPFVGVVGIPYQSNTGTVQANPNVGTGNVYPNTGTVGTQYPGTGVTYPNNAAGMIIPNTNTAVQAYPPSSSNAGGLGSPNSVHTENSGVTSIFTSPSPQRQKVELDIYYETNCPDSKRFITDQLAPVYRDFKDIIELRLVPFGKSQSWLDPITNQYQFRCQHGPEECYGNTVQGCAMSFYPDVETHLNFIDCMESYPRPSDNGLKCARRLSLDWNSISKCAEGEEGRRISNRNGELTKALQPRVTFVPWININRVHNDVIQRRSLRDLKSVVCDAYKAPHPKC